MKHQKLKMYSKSAQKNPLPDFHFYLWCFFKNPLNQKLNFYLKSVYFQLNKKESQHFIQNVGFFLRDKTQLLVKGII